MVLRIVSNEENVMPPQGIKNNSAAYINLLNTVVKPWVDRVKN